MLIHLCMGVHMRINVYIHMQYTNIYVYPVLKNQQIQFKTGQITNINAF